jgi:group I intron endonuclease
MITTEKLRASFDYDQATGRLVRKVNRTRAKVGDLLGHLGAYGHRRADTLGCRTSTARLVWLWHHSEFPDGNLEHINGDLLDDRIENLRKLRKPVRVIAADRSLYDGAVPQACGIYEITHLDTNRNYVGSAVNVGIRWREHQNALVRNQHHSPALQRAWNKHGREAFGFRLLLICKPTDLIFYEQRAIDRLRSAFNCNKTAGSMLGHRHSDASRAKMSASRPKDFSPIKGRRHSEETKRLISQNRKGKTSGPFTDERRRKISKAGRGRAVTAEHRAKISATLTGRSTGRGKLTPDQVRAIRGLHAQGHGRVAIARMLGITTTIIAVLNGNGYAWVT